MQIYKLPAEDIRFILETFGYEAVTKLEGYEAYDLDTTMAMIEESANFASTNFSHLTEAVITKVSPILRSQRLRFLELYAKFVSE